MRIKLQSINIHAANASEVAVKIFDDKGALVKIQQAGILAGSNLLNIDTRNLSAGSYQLAVEWNKGQMKKTLQIIKQ